MTDDRMETITDRPHVVDVDEHGYHRCRDCGLVGGAPPDLPCSGTITDPALIRATDDPDERTTPAPVGDAVALDLDGVVAHRDNLAAMIRRLSDFLDGRGLNSWKHGACWAAEDAIKSLTARAEAAEALDLHATAGEVARLRRNLTATAQDATDAKCARDAARREADQLRHLLGSHADGHRCTCTMTDPGVYHGDNMHPPEWEQDPWCPTHPHMPYVIEEHRKALARAEAAEAEVVTLRAKVAALQVAVSHSAESCADGPCEFHETVARAESAEAKVAAVQALAEKRDVLYPPKWAFGAEENYCNGYRQARADFIAAMATGEGQ